MKLFTVKIEDCNLESIINFGKKKLTVAEFEEVLKYKFKKGQAVKIVSLLLTKYIINNEFNLDKYTLKKNKYGKPYVEGFTGAFFNISHSGEWVIAGISKYELGVDVEEKKEFRDFLDIAKRFFSKEEYAHILYMKKTELQIDAFYDIWTKKESFIKAVGQGISLNLSSFTVPFRLNICNGVNYNNSIWCFMETSLGEKYPVAVCEKDFSSGSIDTAYMKYNDL